MYLLQHCNTVLIIRGGIIFLGLVPITSANNRHRTRKMEELGKWKDGPPTTFIDCSLSTYDYSYYIEKCYTDEESGANLEEEWGGQVCEHNMLFLYYLFCAYYMTYDIYYLTKMIDFIHTLYYDMHLSLIQRFFPFISDTMVD